MFSSFFKQFTHLKSALRYIWEGGKNWTIANAVFIFLQGTFPLVLIYLMKLLIEQIEGIADHEGDEGLRQLMLIVIATGIVFFLNSFFTSVGNLVKEHESQLVSNYLHGLIQKKTTSLDINYFENPEYHNVFHRAVVEAPYRLGNLVSGFVTIFQNIISLILIAGIVAHFNWIMFLILFVSTVPGIFIRLKYAVRLYTWKKEKTKQERKAHYFNRILTDKTFAKEVRLFGLSAYFGKRFQQIKDVLRLENYAILKNKTVYESLFYLISTLVIFGAIAHVSIEAYEGNITIGSLVMYILFFQRGLGFFRSMLNALARLYEDSLFLNYLDEFFKLENKIANPLPEKAVHEPPRKMIQFREVNFHYPVSQRNVFTDLNIDIPIGQNVAIVGDNGAGKTTLIKLLCRFYDPDKGEILFDHNNIKHYPLTELRKMISVVFQDFILYHLTAEENIWFGNIQQNKDSQKIKTAAKNAGIHDTLMNIPHQYKANLGNLFENSEELSLGEWQKLAIARAFFRDARIIILDEPTSSLDAETEFNVFQKFRELTKGKTSVIISHRFSTVKLADYIYVIDESRVKEQGTHDELMKAGGKYATMFKKQAMYYQ